MISVLLGVCAALSWSIHDILARSLAARIGPFRMAALVMVAGGVLLSGHAVTSETLSTARPATLLLAASLGLAYGFGVAGLFKAFSLGPVTVVAPLTAQLAGRSFRYRSLGRRTLRGIGEPMEIFEVSGTRSSLNRFKALRSRSGAPLVGRSEEVELLLNRWRRATESEGQVALLSGDAGIGKSRLLRATRALPRCPVPWAIRP